MARQQSFQHEGPVLFGARRDAGAHISSEGDRHSSRSAAAVYHYSPRHVYRLHDMGREDQVAHIQAALTTLLNTLVTPGTFSVAVQPTGISVFTITITGAAAVNMFPFIVSNVV